MIDSCTTKDKDTEDECELEDERELAIVTGGGSGIGRIIAAELVRAGFAVLVCGRRPPQPMKGARGVVADVSTAEGRRALVSATEGRPVRVLVQNAGAGEPAKLADLDEALLDAAWHVNVVGPLLLVRDLQAQLAAAPDARILHLGTSVAYRPQLGTACYGITKCAFHRMYQQLNVELQGLDVHVGSLSPGLVDTKGVREHVRLARARGLPHVAFFDKALSADPPMVTPAELLAECAMEMLLSADADDFTAKEWHVRTWHQERQRRTLEDSQRCALNRRIRTSRRIVSCVAAAAICGLFCVTALRRAKAAK